MSPEKTPYSRKLASALVIAGALFLLALINVSVISAHTPVQPQIHPAPHQINGSPASPLALNFTPVTTLHLPIILRASGSSNPSTPTPTSTPTTEPTSTPTAEPTLTPVSCQPTNGSGGLPVGTHHTTVAGLNAVVVVGEGYEPQTPAYLGFNIHGDGGLYRMLENPSNPLKQFANQRGWILVSPQSPNGSSWWSNWQGDHYEALAGVFEEMFAKYNLCRNIVFGTTGSGGSEFWTSQFFPARGDQYPAHTVVACGGNYGYVTDLGQNPDVVARSTFYYVYGTEDNLAGSIEDSIYTYTEAGFNVYVEVIQGGGHCNKWREQGLPTWHQRTAVYWAEMAAQLGVE